MDDANAILVEELSGLLRRLPGVSIDSADIRPGHLSLIVGIEKIESIGPIVYCASGANVPLDMWTTAPPKPLHERANPAHLRYRIMAKNVEGQPNAALEAFEFFGVFLVWYLHGVGALAEPDANRLLKLWDGKSVPA